MSAKKNAKTGKWDVQYRFTDSFGKIVKTTKRGFNTKREADEWVIHESLKRKNDVNMMFTDFIDLYMEDCKSRLKLNTLVIKEYVIKDKVIPYFGKYRISEITPVMVRKWQNKMIDLGLSKTYLKTINNQLTAMFNYACQFYGLKQNPCRMAGSMGKSKSDEMNFWTKDQFQQFADSITDKPIAHTMYTTFFWTGMRLGELLALTPADIDFVNNTIDVNKSLQRIHGEVVVTEPKTEGSKRIITIPQFLSDELAEYCDSQYVSDDERIFDVSKQYVEKELRNGAEKAGLPRIRVHDLRHSHAALLVEMGFPMLAIAKRLGHEKIQTTMNTYGHLYPNKQASIAKQLDEKYREEL